MKPILSILLSLSILFGLFSCDGTQSTLPATVPTETDADTSPSEAVTEPTETEEITVPTETEVPDEAPSEPPTEAPTGPPTEPEAFTAYLETVPRADEPIYSGPGYDYSYAGTVRLAGVYTIVEEAWDADGNLWGRLKSGAGWIDLTHSRSPVTETDIPPITGDFADAELLNSGAYLEYIADSSEYAVMLAFRASTTLRDVSFTSLQYDGFSYEVAETLYTLSEMTPELPFVAGVVFYGDMTTYGISFTDSEGIPHYYAIYTSGRDGSLILQEYQP